MVLVNSSNFNYLVSLIYDVDISSVGINNLIEYIPCLCKHCLMEQYPMKYGHQKHDTNTLMHLFSDVSAIENIPYQYYQGYLALAHVHLLQPFAKPVVQHFLQQHFLFEPQHKVQ